MEEKIVKKLDNFFNKFKQQEFKKGEILVRADDNPLGIYYIEEGLVRQYALTGNGEELTLNIYKPHAFFPMSFAISNQHNKHFYEAMMKTTVRRAPKEEVLQFIKNDSEVIFDLLRRLYIGIEGLWEHIEYLMAGNAYAKLLTAVIILAKRFGKVEKNGLVLQLKLTEKDLAAYAGISRETASRELQLLRQKNFLHYEKGVVIIRNIQALEQELLVQV